MLPAMENMVNGVLKTGCVLILNEPEVRVFETEFKNKKIQTHGM